MRQRVIWTWLIPVVLAAALGLLLSAIGATAEPLASARVACTNGLGNGGFEEDTDWTLPGTAFPAAYSTAMAHTGERSLRAGILTTEPDVYSYSAANQAIVFPTAVPTDVATGTMTATLTVWWWPITTEGELTQTVGAAAVDQSVDVADAPGDR